MVDYQFLGLVAVISAVVTGGSLLPAVAVTALVALLMLAYEAANRRYRRRRPHAAGPDDAPAPSDAELTRWMSVMDRVLRSHD